MNKNSATELKRYILWAMDYHIDQTKSREINDTQINVIPQPSEYVYLRLM